MGQASTCPAVSLELVKAPLSKVGPKLIVKLANQIINRPNMMHCGLSKDTEEAVFASWL